MHRVDIFPTHEYQGLKLRPGRPYPFGATVFGNAVNFSVYSRYATDCTLVLFHNREEEPFIEIPFFKEFRLGNVFSMMVFDLDYENIEYGYRMDGPFDPAEGHRFDKSKILLDPYARSWVAMCGGNSPIWTISINTGPVWCSTTSTGRTTCPWRHPSTILSSMRCMCVTSHVALVLV